MKKLISFIFVLFILLQTGFSCADHVSVNFDCDVQPSLNSEWHIWSDHDTFLLTGSLLQEYAMRYTDYGFTPFTAYERIMLMIKNHAVFSRILYLIDQTAETGTMTESGFYSGDCFDLAVCKQEFMMTADDIRQLIRLNSSESSDRSSVPLYHCDVIVQNWLRCIEKWLEKENMQLRCRIFDHGKYYSFHIEKENSVYLTFSVNHTDAANINGVLSFSEEGRIYDIGFQSMTDGKSLSFSISVCSDPDRSGYRIAGVKHPIFCLSGMFEIASEENCIHYTGSLSSADDSVVLSMNGKIQTGSEQDSLEFRILNDRTGTKWGSFRCQYDNAAYDPESKKAVSDDEENGSTFEFLKMSCDQYLMVLLNHLINPALNQ